MKKKFKALYLSKTLEDFQQIIPVNTDNTYNKLNNKPAVKIMKIS